MSTMLSTMDLAGGVCDLHHEPRRPAQQQRPLRACAVPAAVSQGLPHRVPAEVSQDPPMIQNYLIWIFPMIFLVSQAIFSHPIDYNNHLIFHFIKLRKNIYNIIYNKFLIIIYLWLFLI